MIKKVSWEGAGAYRLMRMGNTATHKKVIRRDMYNQEGERRDRLQGCVGLESAWAVNNLPQ